MARFTSTTTAEAVITASRSDIWDVLVDPDLVARITPFVREIVASGDHWRWSLSKIPGIGIDVAPSFTEVMTLEDQVRIAFSHDPPAGSNERTGVEGWYDLADAPGGTRLRTSLTVTAELPAPRLSSPAVSAAMRRVMATMGDRFSKNLLDHLGARQL